jgi:hypothetical protein
MLPFLVHIEQVAPRPPSVLENNVLGGEATYVDGTSKRCASLRRSAAPRLPRRVCSDDDYSDHLRGSRGGRSDEHDGCGQSGSDGVRSRQSLSRTIGRLGSRPTRALSSQSSQGAPATTVRSQKNAKKARAGLASSTGCRGAARPPRRAPGRRPGRGKSGHRWARHCRAATRKTVWLEV